MEKVNPRKISSQMFLNAFKDQWNADMKSSREEIFQKYYQTTQWTDFMQTRGQFINKIMNRIAGQISTQLEYATEWSKMDCLFVSGKNLIGSNLTYPSEIHALVEHENGNDPEIEMWNLLHWRSPLKVIIFYDWSDEDRANSTMKKDWLKNTLALFKNMKDSVAEFHSEDSATNYLFIIGTHRFEGDGVYWRWATPESLEPQVFIPPSD